MPKKRKKKTLPAVRLSDGPLPLRYAGRFDGQLLVFSDASLKRHGGLAAVLFAEPDGTPLIGTRTVPATGSNELELQAALFGLEEARRHFPGRRLTLFCDNRDAVSRLDRARALGLAQDPALAAMLAEREIADALDTAGVCWVQGHARCRGNALADQHAVAAATASP